MDFRSSKEKSRSVEEGDVCGRQGQRSLEGKLSIVAYQTTGVLYQNVYISDSTELKPK